MDPGARRGPLGGRMTAPGKSRPRSGSVLQSPRMSILARQPGLETRSAFDPLAMRADFPILRTLVNGRPLVYLDNAATTQKPAIVLSTLRRYYETANANIHRGVYTLSKNSTELYEQARRRVARFLNAASEREVIFTRGTTESINLVAASLGRQVLKPGDEIILSHLEHHSNIVPWQLVAQQTGAVIRVVPITDTGELRMDEYERLLGERTRIVAMSHLSNSLGTIIDAQEVVRLARQRSDAKVLIDGAQWVAHFPTDVQAIDCDFYVFSGHKIFGPTGIGVLWGRQSLLDAMPPYQGGGDMISSVSFSGSTWNELPMKFEAGTPNIAGAIGLGTAVDYAAALDLSAMAAHEHTLLEYATELMSDIPGLRLVGTAPRKASVLSFVVDGMHPQDIGLLLDTHGVAVRTGHHCCQPVMERFGIPATARASLAAYNTIEDVDALVHALRQVIKPRASASPGSLASPGSFSSTASLSSAAHASAAPASTAHPSPPARSANDAAGSRAAAAASAEPTGGDGSPSASAGSPAPGHRPQAEAAQELVDVFDFLSDWNERYQHLLEMGEHLAPMSKQEMSEANRVHGCQSTVYLAAHVRPGTDVIDFVATSDAGIVRGLIAVLQRVYSGQRAADILAFDIRGLLKQLDLEDHLSPTRRNGLWGMVERIRSLAAAVSAKS